MNTQFLTDWRKRKIDAIGVGVCLVAMLLFYLSGIRPILHRREGQAAQEQQLAAQLENAIRLDERAAVVRDELAEAAKALEVGHIELQPARQINRRIAKLADRASGNGLKLDQIHPGSPTQAQGGKHVTIPIRLRGSGSYRAWAGFLHDLAVQFPDTSVHSFRLSADPGDQAKAANFQVDLVWFATADYSPAGK